MSERTSYAPGTPNWVDLGTPDPEAATAFYGPLFGWTFDPGENPEETGGYLSAMKDGRPAGGVMRLMQEGQPPAWSSYLSVEDADAALAAVEANGGSVAVPAMDILDIGRMGFFVDPTGAFCGVWQPKTFHGAGVVNEPGAFAWNELETRDPDAAKTFYGAVFGWTYEDHEMGEMGTYTEWKLGDASVGGMANVTGRVPDEVPAHWMVYFGVEDADAAVDQIKASGGQVHFGPVDIPAGRFAMAADPWGAAFAVIKLAG
jgi:hypothetical protein